MNHFENVKVIINEPTHGILVTHKDAKGYISNNTFIYPASVVLLDNNVLVVRGEKLDYRYHSTSFISLTDVNIDDVEDKYIVEKTKFFSRKKYKELKEGYVLLKKRVPFNETFVNFRIEIDHENILRGS
jgi:hypothetical protein